MNLDINFSFDDLTQLWRSTVGLERETLRMDRQGHVTQTDHPKEWGSRNYHPYIQTDFSESQIELITPPFSSNHQVINWLAALHQIIEETLSSSKYQETLWPYSMPPVLDNLDQIRPAQLEDENEFAYRNYLMEVYGKKVQLVSGIHFNFQINDQLLNSRLSDHTQTAIQERNATYMKLTKNYLYYRWVLTYLLGATPLVDAEYQTHLYGTPHKPAMKSVRQSRYGYQNSPNVSISYQDIDHFVNDIESLVESGHLSQEKELYRDVRMRGAKPTRKMLEHGITYLEFRNFDLNPFNPYGISTEDVDFVKLWLVSLLLHNQEISEEEIDLANDRNRECAESNPLDPLNDAELFDDFSNTLKAVAENLDQNLNQDHYLSELLASKLCQLEHPCLTLSGQLYNLGPDFNVFSQTMMDLSFRHQHHILKNPYHLEGFESFELSTQALLKDALRLGIKVDILDHTDNLLKLQLGKQIEFVRNANMTSKDSQITHFLLDNKAATKLLLSKVGVNTPHGETYSSERECLAEFPRLHDQAFVIKPQNSNYGLGISIFPKGCDLTEFKTAIRLAFKEDSSVIIEEFVEGTELRFYVQDGKVLAVCERQPAQVIGDGLHTIEELIQIENHNPLRGPSHYAPLSFLTLSEAELNFLQNQQITSETIPSEGQTVLLRKNSNVSTGGIAIDRTDQVHPAFIEIASLTAKAMGACLCGVDIIIKDFEQNPSSTNPYAVLETNYNPMITLHQFPAQGKARNLTTPLLELLFSQLKL